MSFNTWIRSGFSGLPVLAYTFDMHRNRPVKVFKLPGDMENVGVHDGVDKWIAPVIADPFQVSVARLLAEHSAGTLTKPHVCPRYAAHTGQSKSKRRVLVEEFTPPAKTRKRVTF